MRALKDVAALLTLGVIGATIVFGSWFILWYSCMWVAWWSWH